MVSHDLAAIRQTAHRMIYLEETIKFDGETSEFPDLTEIAELRGINPVHDESSDTSIRKLARSDTRCLEELLKKLEEGLRTVSPILEFFAPIVPGNTFPLYFEIGLFQSALIAAILSTIIAGLMGSFLLIRNLS